ncbi:MAG: hypothetical protein M1533_01665 [Candidatus Thermoplasmatota archaeon]|jgi:hypothetical protein|nr:hypothetical protein [Candidatus Thermoplasmatota archaeon]MCL5793677.1 hypothetical protein [Candidatus Thermoplasmatota archaeon]
MTDFRKCFENIDGEEDAAEAIHCLKKYGEIVMFSAEKRRLVLGRELYDSSVSDEMARLSGALGIRDLESYRSADRKYNLTMY